MRSQKEKYKNFLRYFSRPSRSGEIYPEFRTARGANVANRIPLRHACGAGLRFVRHISGISPLANIRTLYAWQASLPISEWRMRTGSRCARRARRARFDERGAPPTNEATLLGCFVRWSELTKKMPLIFSLTKSFSSAIWTFCDARIIEMDCNIYLIPFGFEFGFTFWTNVCFRYYNYIQDNKQDKYGNGYKIPRDIEMATKPIHLTG